MDIISHGLWGSIAFGRRNQKSFATAFLFGIAPDTLAFGPFFVLTALGFLPRPDFSTEPPQSTFIPDFVHSIYNVTHSLVIFLIIFAVLWAVFQKPIWESLAWGLHIILDIPTHSYQFFPTPFLWPLSDVMMDGHSWGSWWIFGPNAALLFILYIWYFYVRKRKHRSASRADAS